MKSSPDVLKGFIVLEGLDGAGTTTQLHRVAARFDAAGSRCHPTCEPTDGVIGRLIRSALRREITFEPRTLALLFAADRNEHLFHGNEAIVSILKEGSAVLCDRYLFSSLAYQSIGCSYEFVNSLNQGFPMPEHLFFIDVPPEECQRRLAHRAGVELFEEIQLQEEILRNYHRGIESLAGGATRVTVVDGTLPPEQVEEKIWRVLSGSPIEKR